jgi:hypothetical protein
MEKRACQTKVRVVRINLAGKFIMCFWFFCGFLHGLGWFFAIFLLFDFLKSQVSIAWDIIVCIRRGWVLFDFHSLENGSKFHSIVKL